MFVFPSFAFHRTIPFESSQQGAGIAFDLLVWDGFQRHLLFAQQPDFLLS